MGMYKFSEVDAYRFADHVNQHCRVNGRNLIFKRCPYCGYNSKPNDKEKFAINLDTGQFNCFRASCGAKGNMITLSRDFNFSLGREVDTYYQTTDYSKKQFRKFIDAHRKIEPKPAAVSFLESRGISEQISSKYEITMKNDSENILVFPFKDENGELQFIKYRNIEFVKGKGNKEWCEANCKPILFGMNHCDPDNDEPLIITEGQIDSLSVAMAGYKNAVSVPTGANGFTWVPHCWDFVGKFKKIIVMGDCENGKITLADEIASRWSRKVYICQSDDYLDCKDANDILRKHGTLQIRNCIENAKPRFDQKIKQLSMVQSVDIMAVETISTKIKSLDRILDGGFRVGQLAILTGKRGEGKSTLASQFAIEAIDQGKNAFIYSGELMDFMVKYWMDCQVTLKKDHSQSDIDKLAKWYGNRAYIYDNSFLNEKESEEDNIVDTIIDAIEQMDCKFIVIDNLMTALTDDLSSDIYRMQSKFVGSLASISKKYGVFILLIAHPRKTYSNHLTNDDISGSSNISDKADLVLTFGKYKNQEDEIKDESLRGISVIKNRLTGKTTRENQQLKLVYDSGSRRLSENTTDMFAVKYDWNTDPYGFESVDDMEIPF